MAILLISAGLYMRSRVASDLDAGVNRGLRARVIDVRGLLEQSRTGLRQARSEGVGQADFAQVLSPRGRVLDWSTFPRPVLSPNTLRLARRQSVWVDRVRVPGVVGTVRLLAEPVTAQDHRVVLVVGSSLVARDDALNRVVQVMALGGPVLLVIASLAAYTLAALALRPVERMRRRAEGIWTRGVRTRLPRTGARDELDRLAATLNESLDRVEDGLRREQGFVADASHELRTPLTVLRAQLEILATEPVLSEAIVREEIGSAIEEVDRLSELADAMLLLARTDAGELDEPTAEVEVAPVLTRVGQRVALLDGRVDVVVDGAEPGLWVRGVESRVEQSMMNLIDNALRHGASRATVEVRPVADRVEFHVLDDGPGFPLGFEARAFERFTRGEAGRSRGGAGLGMAIVRACAEAYGGGVGATNRPEGGADVWFSLPVRSRGGAPIRSYATVDVQTVEQGPRCGL